MITTPGGFYDSVMGTLQDKYGKRTMEIISSHLTFVYFPNTGHCGFMYTDFDWTTRRTSGHMIADLDCHEENVSVLAAVIAEWIDKQDWELPTRKETKMRDIKVIDWINSLTDLTLDCLRSFIDECVRGGVRYRVIYPGNGLPQNHGEKGVPDSRGAFTVLVAWTGNQDATDSELQEAYFKAIE